MVVKMEVPRKNKTDFKKKELVSFMLELIP